MAQNRRRRARDKVLKPVRPSAYIEEQYRKWLERLVDDMQASYRYWISAQYRKTPPIAMDAAPPEQKRVTAWQASDGRAGMRWFAWVDGKILQGRNGARRSFKTQAAAEAAGLRAAGPGAVLTEPTGAGFKKNPSDSDLKLQLSPAESLDGTLIKLKDQWQAEFDAAAPRMAEWFATKVEERSTEGMQRILRDGNISVDFQLTPAMKDALDATAAENVGLIRSIPSEYHTQVQGMVMRSVARGRDLHQLTNDLEERYGITRRRAALIALDQNNKATSVMNAARQREAGIKQAIWLHSHAGKKPRRTHLANNGKPYDVEKGWFDPDPKVNRFIQPGELINCRCTSRPIVKGFS